MPAVAYRLRAMLHVLIGQLMPKRLDHIAEMASLVQG